MTRLSGYDLQTDIEDDVVASLNEFVDHAHDSEVAGLLLVYLTTDGTIKTVMGGPIGSMKAIGAPALEVAKQLVMMVDEVRPNGEPFRLVS
jgi:hypothetical protein